MLLETRGDGPVVFDFVEEAFDQVAIAIEEGAERRNFDAPRQGLDVGPGAAGSQAVAQRVAVIGTIGEEDLPLA